MLTTLTDIMSMLRMLPIDGETPSYVSISIVAESVLTLVPAVPAKR